MDDIHYQRQAALFEQLPEQIDTAVLTPSESLHYLTGLTMHKSERPTLLFFRRKKPPIALLPRLEVGRVQDRLSSEVRYFTYQDSDDPIEAASKAFQEIQTELMEKGSVAVEYRGTRLVEYQLLVDKCQWSQLQDLEPAISALRAEKDDSEIEHMRTAAKIIDGILEETIEQIEIGDSETEIEREIQKRVLDSSADRYSGGIVTVGERTALPHTTTGTQKVADGDLVMIDAGVVYNGYYSDITRTVAVGEIDEELRSIYETVQRAAQAAREAVSAGVPYQDLDRAARTMIGDAGYGDFFPHRVGHGLGLEGHEPPYLAEGNESTLSVGNAFTIEPGIYVEGLGGVRIEDDVVLTDNGSEVLTQTTRELIHL